MRNVAKRVRVRGCGRVPRAGCADLEAWYGKLHALSGDPRGALLNACAAYQRAHTRHERYEQRLRDLRRSFLYDFEDGELAPEIRALMHL